MDDERNLVATDQMSLKLLATGFVSAESGSVASANALLLRNLLKRGSEVTFFSKPSFVDPRPLLQDSGRFRFQKAENVIGDRLRKFSSKIPVARFVGERLDSASYNRLVCRKMREAQCECEYDLSLWLGDYARGRVNGMPTVSFVQGPPGTDASSILRRYDEVRRYAGFGCALRWRILAMLRLSALGMPPFRHSDHLIVGSSRSQQVLNEVYGVPNEKISTLPYPIDLQLFRPRIGECENDTDRINKSTHLMQRSISRSLRVLWLGRLVPRKRLDLFLSGAALAIRAGCDLHLTIVGKIGFLPGYERLIDAFPYPDRLVWKQHVARANVPDLMLEHDLLVQPSEDEDFGSSVAEAQACGLPVIVGRTNGNADYLCSRDLRLEDDRPETLASALIDYARRAVSGYLGDPAESRSTAEEYFSVDRVTSRFLQIVEKVVLSYRQK